MEPSEQNLFELQVDHESTGFLSETAKWGKFLSIVGFVCCGLIVLVGLFAGAFMSSFMKSYSGDAAAGPFSSSIGSAFLSFFYIVIALLYFFPCLYLFRFATRMQVALRTNDQRMLTNSFANLKSCFKFLGILTIIILACYVLLIVIVAVMAASLGR